MQTPWLFHSTFRTRIPSIKKLGLGGKQIKNWDFSENGVVCLTNDPEVAFSFCESADEVSDSVYSSGIVVLAVQANTLDRSKISIDRNINGAPSETAGGICNYYTYSGIIIPRIIYVCTRKKGIVGFLTNLKRIPSYE